MSYNSKRTGAEVEAILDSVGGKQDAISDLETIRSGASKGATALQSVPDGYATEVYVDNQIKDIKDVTGWKQTEYTRRANGTIITFSPKLQKGQVIVSLEGIASISLYDESGATRSVNVNILPFVVDKTYVSWAAYVANEPNVIMIVESSVISELAKVATSGDYNDLNNKPNLDVYATKTELSDKVDKVSGKQLTTEDFTTVLKTKLEGLNNYDDTEIENALASLQGQLNTLVSGNASDAINSFNEIIAFLNGIEDSESLDSIIASIEQQIADKMDRVTLAKVATSGSYEDLDNKPTIPNEVTESTVSGWGFTKNTGTYSKPSSGIPKTDLASAVRTSLGKADTAVQPTDETFADLELFKTQHLVSSKNREYRVGTILSGSYVTKQGVVNASASYNHTEKIPVKEGDIVSFKSNASDSSTIYIRFLCAYDENDNPIETSGKENVKTYTVPSGIAYIVLSFLSSYTVNNPTCYIERSSIYVRMSEVELLKKKIAKLEAEIESLKS